MSFIYQIFDTEITQHIGLVVWVFDDSEFANYLVLETRHHDKNGRMKATTETFKTLLEKRPPVFTGH